MSKKKDLNTNISKNFVAHVLKHHMHLKKLNIIYSTLFIYWSNNLAARQRCAWLSSNALNLFSGQHGNTLCFPSGESKSLQVQAWEHSPKKKREGSRSFQTCKDGSLEAFAQKEKRSAEARSKAEANRAQSKLRCFT